MVERSADEMGIVWALHVVAGRAVQQESEMAAMMESEKVAVWVMIKAGSMEWRSVGALVEQRGICWGVVIPDKLSVLNMVDSWVQSKVS